MASKTVEY